MSIIEGFLFGVLGGVLVEALGLYNLRKDYPDVCPKWLKSKFYWSITVIMVLIGGGLVDIYLLSNMTLNPWLAVNVGASAPLILGTVTSQAPDVSPRID